MTTREKIQERIAKMDEAVLPELLEQIVHFAHQKSIIIVEHQEDTWKSHQV